MATPVRNTISNIAGTALQSLFPIVFSAVYFRLLGAERYGLVGFFSMLAALSGLLDFGLGRTVTREVARSCLSPERAGGLRSKVMTLLAIVASLALLFGIGISLGSELIAGRWLQLQGLTLAEAGSAIALMGVTVAMQQPRALWGAVLNGLQRQVLLNGLTVGFVLLRGVAAIVALRMFEASVVAFFSAQLLVATLELLCIGTLAWRALPAADTAMRWRGDFLGEVWRFAGADGLATLIGMAILVGDKILLSRILSLDDFGRYSFVAMFAAVLSRATAPFLQAYFPHFVQVVETKGEDLSRSYFAVTQVLAALIMPAAAILVFFAPEVIILMAGGPNFVDRFAPVVIFLALGMLLSALMRLPHALQLATGLSSAGMWVNLGCALPYLLTVVLLTPRYGVWLPALAWLLVNLLAFPVMIHCTHSRILHGEALRWLTRSVLLPAAVAFPVVGLGRLLAPEQVSWPVTLPWLMAVGAVGLASTLLAAPDSRAEVRQRWRRWREESEHE